MPFNLDPHCVAALQRQLPAALRALRVRSNRNIEFGDTRLELKSLNKILPQHGSIHDALALYFFDNPFEEFVVVRLEDLLQKLPLKADNSIRNLEDLLSGTSLEDLSTRLIEEFQTLPWDHVFLFLFPNTLVEPLLDRDGQCVVGPGARFVRWTQLMSRTFPARAIPPEHEGFYDQIGRSGPVDGSCYLRVDTIGFEPRGIPGPAAESAERTLRAICGLGFAFNIWHRGWVPSFHSVLHPSGCSRFIGESLAPTGKVVCLAL
jgi:hypothetical protein